MNIDSTNSITRAWPVSEVYSLDSLKYANIGTFAAIFIAG